MKKKTAYEETSSDATSARTSKAKKSRAALSFSHDTVGIGVCTFGLNRMTIHSLYVFSKGGSCLYYKEWYRPRSTLSEFPEEDRKLMFGLLFSLKQLMNKMQPIPL